MPTTTEPYTDDIQMTRIIGDHPRTKLLLALISEAHTSVNKSELHTLTGLSRTTIHTHLPVLCDHGLVKEVHRGNGYPEYRINKQNPVSKALAKAEYAALAPEEE